MDPLPKYRPAWELVSLMPCPPTNVTSWAGELASTCWSSKPIHMEENGLMNDANGRLLRLAMLRGRPGCTNIARVEGMVMPASDRGGAALWPLSPVPPEGQVT